VYTWNTFYPKVLYPFYPISEGLRSSLITPLVVPVSPSNCNSLGTSVLDEASRNKEIIKVNVIARALRRLR